MSKKKSGGSARSLRDSNAQYLGTKLYDGQGAQAGSIIVRQRGTKILPGQNVRMGKDHTLYATTAGKIKFGSKRVKHFDGSILRKKTVNVIAS